MIEQIEILHGLSTTALKPFSKYDGEKSLLPMILYGRPFYSPKLLFEIYVDHNKKNILHILINNKKWYPKLRE